MKVAIHSESRADTTALTILVEAILEANIERSNQDLEARDVHKLLDSFAAVYRGVYYQSDAEALVVVVDSDDTMLHENDHDASSQSSQDCRYCRLSRTVAQQKQKISPRADRPNLKVAIGLTVPSIEAWYLVGKEHQIGEPTWKRCLAEGKLPFSRRELKRMVYGTDRPSIEAMTDIAVKEVRRIVDSKLVDRLEEMFPAGFGIMAKTIREWR